MSPVVGRVPVPPVLPEGVLFAPVPGWVGIAADSTGCLWSCRRSAGRPRRGQTGRVRLGGPWKPLKAYSTGKRGWGKYPAVQRTGRVMKVHHAVLLAFRGPRPAGAVSRHLDDDPENNRLENLCWGTRQQNIADAHRNGRFRKGERMPQAKLTEAEIAEIHSLAGTLSQRDIARRFGCCQGHIWNVLHNRRWRHLDHQSTPEAACA